MHKTEEFIVANQVAVQNTTIGKKCVLNRLVTRQPTIYCRFRAYSPWRADKTLCHYNKHRRHIVYSTTRHVVCCITRHLVYSTTRHVVCCITRHVVLYYTPRCVLYYTPRCVVLHATLCVVLQGKTRPAKEKSTHSSCVCWLSSTGAAGAVPSTTLLLNTSTGAAAMGTQDTGQYLTTTNFSEQDKVIDMLIIYCD